tara:strand:+ start:722 stop:1000 length:279 start_codon:yes stop_codon:yes gene_type:complete
MSKVIKLSLAKKIANEFNFSLDDSKYFIDIFLSIISTKAKSNTVKISGFGTFSFNRTPERNGRNPKTKESYIIHPTTRLVFKPSNKVKKEFN